MTMRLRFLLLAITISVTMWGATILAATSAWELAQATIVRIC